jgi:pimeloyl-ACP methyl ester carboxylesterase
MLEVIDKGSSTESHPAPLLFVHGGCLSAWCWDDHFLDFFADNGYRAIALNLRGHTSGESANTIAATLGVSRATVYRVLAARNDE